MDATRSLNKSIERLSSCVPRRLHQNVPFKLSVENQYCIQPNGVEESRQFTAEEDNSIRKLWVEEMFFEWHPYDHMKDAYISFDVKGCSLTLEVSGKRIHITQNDTTWLVM
jgi:hypothetical protein